MSSSLWPHELQYPRLPCPPLPPRVCSNSYPLSWWCYPTISSSVDLNLFQHQCLFQWVGSLHQVAKVLELFFFFFSFSINPSNEYSGLISFRIDWFDLAVQVILKSLLQHHILKTSVLQHSAFFMVQLSHPYMTTGKTTVLTIWTFFSKVMSLLFNTEWSTYEAKLIELKREIQSPL